MNSSILSRVSPTLPVARAQYTPLQAQVDGLVGGFVHHATDWRSLAAMTAGGLAYRAGRIGMSSGVGVQNFEPLRRILSITVGLTAEVSTFELVHRGLHSVTLTPALSHQGRGGQIGIPSPLAGEGQGEGGLARNLWRWSGPGGLRQGFLHSFITFGALKGAGHIARGENLIAQHLFQDSAMVLGHQVSGALGISPPPTGNLTEQFLQAEATTLQIGAGLALGHRFAPGLMALERGLDLSARRWDSLKPLNRRTFESSNPSAQFALAAVAPVAGSRRPALSENPDILLCVDHSEGQGSAFPQRPRVYWFPERATRGGPLHVKYTEATKALADRLMDFLSSKESAGRRPPENYVSLLWVQQWLDMARTLQADMEIHGPERLPKPLVEGGEGGDPLRVAQALELLRGDLAGPESEWVLELKIPYENVSFGKQGTAFRTDLVYILQTMEVHLGNTVRLVERIPGSRNLLIRLPTPPMLERLLQVSSGEEATRFHYVMGEISQARLVRMKAEGEAPIGLSRDPVLLGDLGIKVHPAFFALHDLFHAISLSVFSQSFRRYAGWLYETVSQSRLRRSPLTREHLDRLSDMDPPIVERRTYEAFFSYLFAHLADHYKKDFGSEQIRCRELLKYRYFLQDYLDLLEKNPPDNPEWRAWNERIRSQLRPILKGLDGILQKLNSLYFDFPKQK